MRWLTKISLRMRSLFHRRAADEELDAELRSHLERQIAANVSAGMSVAEARRAAMREFGGVEGVKEECRDMRKTNYILDLAQDVRFGLRMLLKNWKLASIAAFSLAVAMALSVAGLSVFNGIMLRPPLATAPEQLVSIFAASAGGEVHNVSYPDYEYYRDNNHSFSGLAAFPQEIGLRPMTVGGTDETGTVESVSDNYFEVMGIRPSLGRLFVPGDDGKRVPEAILTYSGWKRWGADPKIVGKTVELAQQRRTLTIVGVAPKDFTGVVFGFSADVITTLAGNSQAFIQRNNRWLFLIGRLKPAVTQQHVRAEMQTLLGQLAAAYPKTDKDLAVVVTPAKVLPSDARSTAELISAVLMGIVLMVLLIACANVANLLLGLATGRKQEMLIRAALGATRKRLIRQLLTESAILCALGGAAGFLIASVALAQFSQFSALMPLLGTFHFEVNFRTNETVLLMTLALIFIASVATGLTPAIYASATNVAGALSGEAVVGGTHKSYIRNALVVIQVAVCTLVMVGVGLCVRSLQNLKDVNLGFSTRNLAAVMIDLQSNGISEARGLNSYRQLKQAALQLGGAQSCSLAVELPLIDSDWSTDGIRVEGASDAAHWTQIPVNVVDGDYFTTLGIPLLRGRTFNSSDAKKSPEVVLINHEMAETYWRGANPIGKQMRVQSGNRVLTVVGVVGDSKYNTVDETVHPVIYYALSQHYQPALLLAVRTQGDPRLWVQPLSKMVRGFGLQLDGPPFTFNDIMYFSLLIPILTLRVVSALGALALMLAVLGLYGAIFYSVNERKREIGIRVALGAQPFHLLKLFLRQAALISGAGVSIGLFLGVAATILFRSQFYGIRDVDLHVLIPVALAMVLVSMAIAYTAARPWVKVNPMEAIRHV
ncbi:MAG TPA: ABC transporter permease [Candidatus Acidoferrales bacterium]|nr:ABC transporter permease [Candidatus Acidoferrales bacterium]